MIDCNPTASIYSIVELFSLVNLSYVRRIISDSSGIASFLTISSIVTSRYSHKNCAVASERRLLNHGSRRYNLSFTSNQSMRLEKPSDLSCDLVIKLVLENNVVTGFTSVGSDLISRTIIGSEVTKDLII